MRATELKAKLNSEIKPVYLLVGEDAYLKESALEELKKLAGEDMTEFNLSVRDGSGMTIGEVLGELSQVPFMADKRVVVIKDWSPNLSDGELKKLIDESENSDTVLVLTYSTTPPNTFKKAFEVVDCAKLDKGAVLEYIDRECTRRGYDVTPQACSKLATYTSCDLSRIQGELNKLFAFCLDNKKIEDSAVDEVVSQDMEFVVYALSNAVANGNSAEAFSILDMGRGDSGKNLGMLTTLTTQFRRMLHLLLNKNMPRGEASTYLGISEYAVGKNLALANKFKPAKLKAIVDRLVDLEYEFKSGRILTADEALFIGVSYALNYNER
ncbi:MAG: DNA polymerase III subunit delta [Clostridia bacterium]|nr:DNA polymerase III subunit delta [Clostridia bacterium]